MREEEEEEDAGDAEDIKYQRRSREQLVNSHHTDLWYLSTWPGIPQR